MRRQESRLAYGVGEFVFLFVPVLVLTYLTSGPPARSWAAFIASLTGVRLLAAAVGALVGATTATLVRWLFARRQPYQRKQLQR